MSTPREIGPIEPSRFGGAPRQGSPHRQEPPPAPRAPQDGDRVDLSAPGRAALALLRERVLARTRDALGLAAGERAAPQFAEDPQAGIEAFVDRLLSAQNALAGKRRGTWPEQRIERALAAGTRAGIAEAIELLDDARQLGDEAWQLVQAVLVELQRKIGGEAERP